MGKEIRKIIRELLVEEIASINKESVSLDQKTTREVIVSIRTDEDLMNFVKKILNIVKNISTRIGGSRIIDNVYVNCLTAKN